MVGLVELFIISEQSLDCRCCCVRHAIRNRVYFAAGMLSLGSAFSDSQVNACKKSSKSDYVQIERVDAMYRLSQDGRQYARTNMKGFGAPVETDEFGKFNA